jgi:hypothetical protein
MNGIPEPVINRNDNPVQGAVRSGLFGVTRSGSISLLPNERRQTISNHLTIVLVAG